MARPEPVLAPEEVAILRNAAQIIFLFAEQIERRDQILTRLLERARGGDSAAAIPQLEEIEQAIYVARALDHIESKVETLASQVAELGQAVHRLSGAVEARDPLISESFVTQANEVLRNLRKDVHELPRAIVSALALQESHIAIIKDAA